MKNQKKIKLALSIALLKKPTDDELQAIRDIMEELKEEVGSFLGLAPSGYRPLNQHHVQEQYALQYEHCTLDVDMIANVNTQNRSVQRLQLR